MLLNAQNIEKHYGDRLLFRFETLKIYRGDKIGIVGDNGAGKSTLIKILAKIIEPDCGTVSLKAILTYVDQLSEKADVADSVQSSVFQVNENAKSGGEIMRKKLAAAFSTSFDILALDEPTSNLDIEAIDILNTMLGSVETLLLISHDRQLLDNHCNKIIEIADGKLTIYNCGWSDYEKLKNEVQLRQEVLYTEYTREKKRLEKAIADAAVRADKMKKAPSRMGNSEARLHKREATAKQAKLLKAGVGIASRLERLDAVEKPHEQKIIKPDFSLTNPPRNKIVIACESLNYGYDDNEVFHSVKLEIVNGTHTAIVGANGCGKTTLLKLIIERPDLIYRVPKIKIGFMSQNFTVLNFNETVLQNVLEQAIQTQTVCRGVLANMGFSSDCVHKKVSCLSGGELIKISLSRLIVSDCNTLILDEPTNYLDINSNMQIQAALKSYQGTLIFVSHDYNFINAVADNVLMIKDKKIVKIQI